MKRCFAPALLAGLLALPAGAFAGKVTIESVKAEAHATIPAFVQNNERGMLTRTMTTPEGKVFLSVTASLQADWDEKTTEIKIDPKKAGLFDGATQFNSVGIFNYTGVFSDYSPSPDLRRPWDFKPGQPAKPIVYHRIFVVPKGVKTLTLRFEDAEAPVAVPEKPTPIDVAAVVDVQIEKAELKDTVESKTRDGGATVTYANPKGKVLVLSLKITPKAANVADDPNRFVWMGEWLALDLGNGTRIACSGVDFMNGISFAPFNPNRYSPDKPWPSSSTRAYFAVPAGTTEATLTWLCAPVAKVSPK